MKVEHIVNPSQQIESLKSSVERDLTELLPGSSIEIIGSMAVPMKGRPEIDVMIIDEEVEKVSGILVENGFKQGPVENGVSYLKDKKGEVEIGVQILKPDNKMVNSHRRFLQRLQNDESFRNAYEKLKMSLDGLSRETYKAKKNEWVRQHLD